MRGLCGEVAEEARNKTCYRTAMLLCCLRTLLMGVRTARRFYSMFLPLSSPCTARACASYAACATPAILAVLATRLWLDYSTATYKARTRVVR